MTSEDGDRANHQPCARCGSPTDIYALDFMPELFNRWWWRMLPLRWANRLLNYAADHGWQFETGLCRRCYGPAWSHCYEERDPYDQ